MQIKSDLPQFEERKALIIVSGEFLAKYYLAHNGQITLLENFAVANPRAQLREDYVDTTKQNGISGSIYDGAKQEVQRKLLSRVGSETKKIFLDSKPDEVLLFCAEYLIKEMKQALAKEVRNAICFEYKGDMVSHHPFDLLKIVGKDKNEKMEKNKVLTPEEVKILRGHKPGE